LIELANLFINNLFPILLIAGIGFVCGRYLGIKPQPISKIIFYVLSPCLIFNLLTTSEIAGRDMIRMVGFTITLIIIISLLALGLGKLIRLKRTMLAAVVLTTMSMNAGNFGLSLNLFSFGEDGLAQASIFFVTTALITNAFGVAVASLGTASIRESLIRLRKVPMIYAVLLALIFIWGNWQLPIPLQRTTQVLADASIPAMLILLGLQLQVNHRENYLPALVLSNSVRLIGGAVIGLLLVPIFGLQGVALQAAVTQAATPTAVISTVISTEFNAEPSFVTSAVFTSTLLCPLTLTPLLHYLGA
jgi:predicted permease